MNGWRMRVDTSFLKMCDKKKNFYSLFNSRSIREASTNDSVRCFTGIFLTMIVLKQNVKYIYIYLVLNDRGLHYWYEGWYSSATWWQYSNWFFAHYPPKIAVLQDSKIWTPLYQLRLMNGVPRKHECILKNIIM